MNDFNIKYTVIIPHYKNLELLDRCVASIANRPDIEVIIIDDCSEIAEEEFYNYQALKRSNVKIYFQNKGGSAGRARNVGLKHAKGKWLIFVDSDDYIIDGQFTLCDKYYNSDYDIVYFGVRSVDSDTLQEVERYKVYNKYIEMCDNVSIETINLLRFRHDVPWGKMIKHELVKSHNIFFGETKYCNDTLFSTLTALYAKSVFSDKNPFYCVTERKGSLTKQNNINADFVRYEVMLKKNRILKNNGYPEYQISVLQYLYTFFKKDMFYLYKALKMSLLYKINPFKGLAGVIKREFSFN